MLKLPCSAWRRQTDAPAQFSAKSLIAMDPNLENPANRFQETMGAYC